MKKSETPATNQDANPRIIILGEIPTTWQPETLRPEMRTRLVETSFKDCCTRWFGLGLKNIVSVLNVVEIVKNVTYKLHMTLFSLPSPFPAPIINININK